MIDGVARAFCCTGCSAASRWICDASLGDYYALRSAAAARVAPDDGDDHAAWDRAELIDPHSMAIDGGRQITLVTDAMRCAACAWLIDRALMREAGVIDASANAVTGRIRIAWNPQRVPLSRLVARLASLGYRVYLAGGEARERARRQARNTWLLRVGVAGLGAMQAMMFAEALYLDTAQQMPLATRDFFRWITFLVSTPVVFYAGWPFLAGMARELRHRAPGMDTLIAGSTLIAYGASLIETLRGGPHVWFDAAVMFVFLLLIARGMEQGARALASARIDALARARPALVSRENAAGACERVALDALHVDDVVRIAAGDAVPADGVLLDADAAFDEALLTGESTPVRHRPGDAVLAGSVCRDPARVRVTHVGADTWLSQLARLVEQAQASRPALARVAERVSAWFVVVLALITALVYFWWRQHDPSRAVEVVIALLVVSCPCALSLAIPAALGAAHGALARLGVLALQPEALAALARVDRIVFDKTGTLGDGAPVVVDCETFGPFDAATARRTAAALEAGSRHPLARAFALRDSVALAPVHALREVAGEGIEGTVDGVRWRIGRFGFVAGLSVDGRHADAPDDRAVWLGNGDGLAARFTVREQPRQDAAEAIAALRARGVVVELCSGDAADAVTEFAHRLGIDDSSARCSPADKLARVRALQARGHVVAMVGDGINDAPVLAGADVSFAMGNGAALAHAAADFVITAPSLLRLPQGIALARRTCAVVRQNLAWAVGYNIVALPLAATGHVTPWLAALGMAASSLLVTGNGLRLLRPVAP
ncbi:Cu2+-exporting ATPase [Chiayiivirga flava]|uniref:Cu2+-exporting ATPase n=2 Tax=Chiayiivirga flava TaxID=659595 RepID=A0A7W8FY77_9GAMM|nr:Cu2+-exporting ATPase [Chiayiivirga flava]